MTAMRKAMSAYGQAIETIPPAQQIVMLYDGIIRHLRLASTAIVERRINDRYIAVEKATLIIEALQSCLDHEKGGEIAPQLDQLYTHFIFRLQAINIEDDVAICDELLDRIGELRASWASIAETDPGGTTNRPSAAAERTTQETNSGAAAAVTA